MTWSSTSPRWTVGIMLGERHTSDMTETVILEMTFMVNINILILQMYSNITLNEHKLRLRVCSSVCER